MRTNKNYWTRLVATGADAVSGKVDPCQPAGKCHHGLFGADATGFSESCSLCQCDRAAMLARQRNNLEEQV